MTIKVVKNLVSKSKYGLKCPNPMKAEYITIHNTANDASAANEISYMKNNSSSTSFHFAVDDKLVIQGIPTNRNAWHTGDGTNGTGNRKSIGVEICYSKSGGARYKAAEKLAIKFVAQLLKERRWGVDRVRKHQDWNGKYCPHRILSEGRWNQVKAAIEKELKALGGKTSSSKISATKKQTTNSSSKKTSYALPSGIFKVKNPMMRGASVTQIQKALAALYFYPDKGAPNHGIDGVYGPKTANAVKRFQSMYGLTQDGIYGPDTKAKLEALLK
ncbi:MULTISPECIES: peptidoglycan recognition protein family protein [Bacillus subtilis group]|uniref:peptidoglycan recognition protein family protein n=1 Tax=Bacillus subtilis group TaxID=653685 RepID=UPI00129E3B05|nr:N-acetylmuramoyl-L-alanine amidase [Bacillus subtilis]MCW0118145.1 N-acetylmuramoyl-L-alanine amidase [Bacillus subtilis]NJI50928.1 N-acetylmuramoyl-L-alanine amidase [Bacillus subtilis]QGI27477.1 N-acetylmuramoyl-L-alanine amidase [Bacillus subtilis]CAF1784832.1 N-acetylmuramoyl-L-alanine amidase CwlA [Bacillus subtilis]CAF1820056.1 N-acetylmuramoyl-L-alanine amidase CwlA [Bacillus subtilis]